MPELLIAASASSEKFVIFIATQNVSQRPPIFAQVFDPLLDECWIFVLTGIFSQNEIVNLWHEVVPEQGLEASSAV